MTFSMITAWQKTCEIAWARCKSLPRQSLMLWRLQKSPAWRRAMREASAKRTTKS